MNQEHESKGFILTALQIKAGLGGAEWDEREVATALYLAAKRFLQAAYREFSFFPLFLLVFSLGGPLYEEGTSLTTPLRYQDSRHFFKTAGLGRSVIWRTVKTQTPGVTV